MRSLLLPALLGAGATLSCALPALAQRADENAVVGAGDAFGRSIGAERIGLYSEQEVRGFSPIQAGNVRLEGLYIDVQGGTLSNRLVQGATVRVGLTAQGYPFPAPTGVVDYTFRGGGPGRTTSINLATGPYGTWGVEVDGVVPVASGVTLNYGVLRRHNEVAPGDVGESTGGGFAAAWRGSRNADARLFWSASKTGDDNATPLIMPSGDGLPRAEPIHYYGQDWALNESGVVTFGAIGGFDPAPDWRLRGVLFTSRAEQTRTFADLFRNVGPDGGADRTMIVNADQTTDSVSGELRLSRVLNEGNRRHTLHAMVRGRDVASLRGGAAVAALGRAVVGRVDRLAPPPLRFGARTADDLAQRWAGLGYEGVWRGLGETSLGVQRTSYTKSVMRPGAASTSAEDEAWLFNAAAAWRATSRLSVYGSATRGLEESGVAPDAAANRGEVLAPIRTRQADAGIRLALRDDLRLVAGVFDVEKPYIALGPDGVFGPTGAVRHRGAEFSLAGPVAPGLTLVAGAVLMSPEVSGEAVRAGSVGPTPIGQTGRVLRLNLDYRPGSGPWSIDGALAHAGDRPARVDGSVLLPERTTIDLGARYRFRVGDARATLRVTATNVTDVYGWNVAPGGALFPMFPRRFTASLMTDF